MVEYLKVFAQYGLPGLIIGLQYLWIWRQERRITRMTESYEERIKDLSKECREEQTARVEDAKAYTNLALELQRRVIDAVHTISVTLGGAEDAPEDTDD